MNNDNQKSLMMCRGNYTYNKSSSHPEFITENPQCSCLDRFLNLIELSVTVPIIIIFYGFKFIFFTPIYLIGRALYFIGKRGLGL